MSPPAPIAGRASPAPGGAIGCRRCSSLDAIPPVPDVAAVHERKRRRVSSGGSRRAAAIVLLAGRAGSPRQFPPCARLLDVRLVARRRRGRRRMGFVLLAGKGSTRPSVFGLAELRSGRAREQSCRRGRRRSARRDPASGLWTWVRSCRSSRSALPAPAGEAARTSSSWADRRAVETLVRLPSTRRSSRCTSPARGVFSSRRAHRRRRRRRVTTAPSFPFDPRGATKGGRRVTRPTPRLTIAAGDGASPRCRRRHLDFEHLSVRGPSFTSHEVEGGQHLDLTRSHLKSSGADCPRPAHSPSFPRWK